MRLKRRMGCFFVSLLFAALSFGSARADKQRFQTTFMGLFDTVSMITAYEDSEKVFQETAARIYAEMEEYDHLYDIYNEYPNLVNLCTINSHPGETFHVDERIMDLLEFGKEIEALSSGRTDVTLGAVLRIWHEARENGINHPESAYLPELSELEAARAHTGFDVLELDSENLTVRLLDAEASLDVGAIAKGYATQRVAEALPEGYLLSIGGNVIATGPKPDGSSWTVGVEDPFQSGGGYLCKISLEKGAVVTSGDYQRTYTVDGEEYHHIIDPETLFPGTKWKSVTVITADSGLADGLSTTLFLMDREEGQALLDQFQAEAMWVAKDGTQTLSPGFEAYIKP